MTSPRSGPTTWLLLANGARARLVSAEGHGEDLHIKEVCEFAADHAPTRDLGRDKPARVFESHGATRHAVEPKTDAHRELKRDFAAEIAEALDAKVKKNQFDRLVIAAPPVTLGDLRAALSEAVRSRVIAEIAMDLTKVPNSDVPKHLEGIVRI